MLVIVSNLDLIQYISETNISVEHLANVLSEKTGSSSWVVVFKALVTVHHLVVHGNERFIKHVSCQSSLFTLHNFLDKSVIEGYTTSTFIRRYSKYLNEKSLAYRMISSDITKTKRGKLELTRATFHILLRSDMKWCQPSEMEIYDGINWQLNTFTCTSTIWNSIAAPLPYMVPTPLGAPSLMAPQPMIHTQQGLRTSSPSTPSPEHQVRLGCCC
ncbi:phosphatidylinositol-binding clathrin assembly protein-like [Pan paniscus]|uniref:phosphatidylinositol-binding clathrin assembly protein-like n=1 Tax=Pan paniscus TaxID=9597 RepID=UPI0030051E47